MRYKFIPSSVAREVFGLKERSYVGAGVTPLLETVLGKENFDAHVCAQDPLGGGKTEGNVIIVMNPEERDLQKMRFRSAGTIRLVP